MPGLVKLGLRQRARLLVVDIRERKVQPYIRSPLGCLFHVDCEGMASNWEMEQLMGALLCCGVLDFTMGVWVSHLTDWVCNDARPWLRVSQMFALLPPLIARASLYLAGLGKTVVPVFET